MSSVVALPAPPGHGLRFETSAGTEIRASADNVVDTSRCTVVGVGDERISTVEHILSACLGLAIADARIVVDGPEIPIGDGGARFWTDLFTSVASDSSEDCAAMRLADEVVVTGTSGSFIAAYPSDRFRLTVAISFPHPLVGTQVARFEGDNPAQYIDEIAGARTFGFIEEVEALRAAGLAMGGSFDNAIVVYPDHYSTELRYDNELARHKLLDVIGDLALSGCFRLPFADIIAVKPSHRLNVELARRLPAACGLANFHEG